MDQDSNIKSQKQLKEQLIKRNENLVLEYLKKHNYVILQKVRHGQFTETFTAFQTNANHIVDIKKLIDINNKEYLDAFNQEKHLLRAIKNNKYALQLIDELEDKNLDFTAIVVEHCECDLSQVLDLNKLTFEQQVALAFQLFNGLLVFQLNGIINGDIKPQNILYNKQKNLFILSDFGQSQTQQTQSQLKSPRNFQNLNEDQCNQSFDVNNKQKPPQNINADVFSIGYLLLELFLSRPLTANERINLKQISLYEAIPNLKNEQNNLFISEIIAKMVNPDQNQRLEPIELLQNIQKFTVNENSLKSLKLNKNEGENILDENGKALQKSCNIVIPVSQNLNGINFEESYNHSEKSQQKQLLTAIQNDHQLQKNPQTNNIQQQNKKLSRKSFGKFLKITEKKNLSEFQEVELKYHSFLEKYDCCCCLSPVKINDVTKAIKIVSNNHNIFSLILNLDSNNINEEGTRAIGLSLEECHNISLLNLSLRYNHIDNQGVKYLGLSLQNCRNITSLNLDIAYNGVNEEGISQLGNSLQKCLSITNLYLNLEGNRLSDLGVIHLSKSLQKSYTIEQLSLNLFMCGIGVNGANIIATSLAKCQYITSLTLSVKDNSIGQNTMNQIRQQIMEKCIRLKSLFLIGDQN
ncbi:hypothetical protein ABPG73_003199 [Tetrahymena malaccensis]